MKKILIFLFSIGSIFFAALSFANSGSTAGADPLITAIQYHVLNNTGAPIPWFYTIDSNRTSPGNGFEVSIPTGLSEYTFSVVMPNAYFQAWVDLNGTISYTSNVNSFEIDTAVNAGGDNNSCTGWGNLNATCTANIVGSTYNINVNIAKK